LNSMHEVFLHALSKTVFAWRAHTRNPVAGKEEFLMYRMLCVCL
jgi:hypothetical protein